MDDPVKEAEDMFQEHAGSTFDGDISKELEERSKLIAKQRKAIKYLCSSRIIVIEVTPIDETDPFKCHGMMVVFSTVPEFYEGMKFDYGLLNQAIVKGYMIQILPKDHYKMEG